MQQKVYCKQRPDHLNFWHSTDWQNVGKIWTNVLQRNTLLYTYFKISMNISFLYYSFTDFRIFWNLHFLSEDFHCYFPLRHSWLTRDYYMEASQLISLVLFLHFGLGINKEIYFFFNMWISRNRTQPIYLDMNYFAFVWGISVAKMLLKLIARIKKKFLIEIMLRYQLLYSIVM